MEKVIDFCEITGESVKEYIGERYYIATGDIIDNKIVSFEKVTYNNKPSRANQNVKVGDVLFAKMKDTKKVIIIDEKNVNNIYSTGFFVITPKNNVQSKYLYWLFNSNKFNEQKNKNCKGATQKALNNDGFSKIFIKEFPTIDEQHHIIYELDKIQEIIDMKIKQIEDIDNLIKSQFVEMFGNPTLNEKQWVKKEIQELVMPDCTISYGIVQTGDEVDDGIPVFRPIDIVNNVPKLENLKKTAKEISDRYKKTILKGNELLITVRANIGDTYIIDESFKDCNVGRGITPLRFDEKYINTNFMKIQLDNDEMKYEIKKLAKGITLLQLNMEDLRKIRVIVPPIELQKDFVDKIKLIDKQKFEIQKSLKEMQKLQESLMNKYFGD